jgi:hypothetical protein
MPRPSISKLRAFCILRDLKQCLVAERRKKFGELFPHIGVFYLQSSFSALSTPGRTQAVGEIRTGEHKLTKIFFKR